MAQSGFVICIIIQYYCYIDIIIMSLSSSQSQLIITVHSWISAQNFSTLPMEQKAAKGTTLFYLRQIKQEHLEYADLYVELCK